MYKILCVAGRDSIRFNQVVQIESMRFDTLEFARKAVEILAGLFTEAVFELLDLEESEQRVRYSECDNCELTYINQCAGCQFASPSINDSLNYKDDEDWQ